MYFRTGNACLLAIFSEPMEEVAELFNREAPTEYPDWRPLIDEPDRPRWTAHLEEAGEWVDVYPGSSDRPHTRVVFDSSDRLLDKLELLFYAMLDWPIKPLEMFLGDEDCHGLAFELYERCKAQVTVDEYLEPIEGNHSAWGTHSLRAFRKETIEEPQSWSLAASERGFKWTEGDDYYLLDVDWENKLEAPPKFDPFSEALNEGHLIEEFSGKLEGTQGTAFLVLLSRKDLNPERSYHKWLKVLPPIAKALSDYCGQDGIVGRYYGFLNLLVVRPTIPKSEAQTEKRNLLNLLRQHGTENSRIEMISWPEDLSDNPNESIFDSLLDLTYSDSPEYSS